MHVLTSMIAKYSLVLSWLVLGTFALTTSARFLDEQTDDRGAVVPQGGPVSTPASNIDIKFSFYMHDIIGGSNPTARAITGIVNNPQLNDQLPFAKPYGAILSMKRSEVKGEIASNFPFFTGLSGTTSNVNQNDGMNNGVQLPVGSTIEKLMFGTMSVVDDELTLGPDLSSGRVGKAQGFYVSSSVDGKSQVMALTAMFESGGYLDTICFFGVHLLGVSESQLAVMGGTGKFVDAKGYAVIKTLPPSDNQVLTDGLETVVQFNVYVTY